MKNIKRMFRFTIIALSFFAGILFAVITKPHWAEFSGREAVLIIFIVMMYFLTIWLSIEYGKYMSRNYYRTRITNTMSKYGKEVM